VRVLGIDPGSFRTGWAVVDSETKEIEDFGLTDNIDLVSGYRDQVLDVDFAVIEAITPYGRVGKTIMDTVLWSGILSESLYKSVGDCFFIHRKTIMVEMCGTPKGNDTDIRHAIIDLYPPVGGGKTPQIGLKSSPGPLFGIKKDIWSAIAVSLAFIEIYLVRGDSSFIRKGV